MDDLLILAKSGRYFGLLDPPKLQPFNIAEFSEEVRKNIYKMLPPQSKKTLREVNKSLQYDLDKNIDVQFPGIYFRKVEDQPDKIDSIHLTPQGILPPKLWQDTILQNSFNITNLIWQGNVKGELPFTGSLPRVSFLKLDNLQIEIGQAAKAKSSLNFYLPYSTFWRNQLVLLETIKAPYLDTIKLNLLSLPREGQDNDTLLHKSTIKLLTRSPYIRRATIDFTIISNAEPDDSAIKFPPPLPELTNAPWERTPRDRYLKLKSLKLNLTEKLPWPQPSLRETYWFQFIEGLELLVHLELLVTQNLPWFMYEDILRHKSDTLTRLRLKGVFPQGINFKCLQNLKKIKAIEIEHQKSIKEPYSLIYDFGLSEGMKENLEILNLDNFFFPMNQFKCFSEFKTLKNFTLQTKISSEDLTSDPNGCYGPELVKHFGGALSLSTLETFDIKLLNGNGLQEDLLNDWGTLIEIVKESLGTL